MSKSSRLGLLVLCLLLSSTARLFVMAAGHSKDRVEAQTHATYFTADFLSSHSSRKASRRFDSKPCADRVYASERNRSLRYLLGPTMDKAVNYQEYFTNKTKSSLQVSVEFVVELYIPFPAGKVYARYPKHLVPTIVHPSLIKSGKELTTTFDAYVSLPSPYVDQMILNDLPHMALFEIVCFKTASEPRKIMLPEVSFIRKQIKKTGLLEQGRQIREQQMIAAYLGEHHTQRTYAQRVLEDSKPRDGEEVYLLKLPEQSGPFYPGLFKDPQWTFELVIKFLTYAISPLLEGYDSESRMRFFNDRSSNGGIIPSITGKLVPQPLTDASPLFHQVVVQRQKYHFLKANSAVSVMSYRKSFIGDGVISPPIHLFVGTPGILLGARRTLLQDDKTLACAFATINFASKRFPSPSSLQKLAMPFRIPKGLADEATKRAEALRQLAKMTELNGLEEGLDLDESILVFDFLDGV